MRRLLPNSPPPVPLAPHDTPPPSHTYGQLLVPFFFSFLPQPSVDVGPFKELTFYWMRTRPASRLPLCSPPPSIQDKSLPTQVGFPPVPPWISRTPLFGLTGKENSEDTGKGVLVNDGFYLCSIPPPPLVPKSQTKSASPPIPSNFLFFPLGHHPLCDGAFLLASHFTATTSPCIFPPF